MFKFILSLLFSLLFLIFLLGFIQGFMRTLKDSKYRSAELNNKLDNLEEQED